jgi:rhamnose utilization protein RhaD (predicted bifunctional aldolase and dehydrogenase)
MLNAGSEDNTMLRNVNNCVTNSEEQNPSIETTVLSASQEIL